MGPVTMGLAKDLSFFLSFFFLVIKNIMEF